MRSLRVMNILTQLLHRFPTVPPPPPAPCTNLAVHAITQTAVVSSLSLIKGGARLTNFGAENKHLTTIPVEFGGRYERVRCCETYPSDISGPL